MTNHTETSVLIHHNVIESVVGISVIDAARAAGVLAVCLGCGTICVAPTGMTSEAYRASTELDADEYADYLDCCPDADSIVY